MAKGTQKRVLRVGVIRAGKLVEQRIIKHGEPVTVGAGLDNVLYLTGSGVPKQHMLFSFQNGKYYLNFDKHLSDRKSRVQLGDSVFTLNHLRDAGLAVLQGQIWSLSLDDRTRGKLVIGDCFILFQFVAAPRPTPMQRAAARPESKGGLRANPFAFILRSYEINGTLVMSLLISLLLQGGFTAWLKYTPPPARLVDPNDFPEEYRMAIIAANEEPEAVAVEALEVDPNAISEVAAEEAIEEVTIEETMAPDPGPRQADRGPRSPEDDMRLARERVRNEAFFSTVAGRQTEGGDPIYQQIFGAGDVSVSDAIRGQRARGDRSLASSGSGGGGNGDGDGEGGSGEYVGVNTGPSLTRERADAIDSGEERDAVRVEARIRSQGAQSSGRGQLDADSLNDEIERRMRDIRNCYERMLADNPSLGGRVVLQFEIGTDGRTSGARFVENEVGDEVGSCILRSVRRWRFDEPDGGSVMVRKTYLLSPAS